MEKYTSIRGGTVILADGGNEKELQTYCDNECMAKCGCTYDHECGCDCIINRMYYVTLKLSEYENWGKGNE